MGSDEEGKYVKRPMNTRMLFRQLRKAVTRAANPKKNGEIYSLQSLGGNISLAPIGVDPFGFAQLTQSAQSGYAVGNVSHSAISFSVPADHVNNSYDVSQSYMDLVLLNHSSDVPFTFPHDGQSSGGNGTSFTPRDRTFQFQNVHNQATLERTVQTGLSLYGPTMELYKTGIEDITIHADYITPGVCEGSEG
ncbi:hypothetical protein DL769_003346 [Monosporascus sp. CRB-8-3]|nr:hypothetical protein DL769_003346 [Monosporascus sp. CRB-8-3]